MIAAVHDLTFVRFPELCTPDTLRYPELIRRSIARGATIQTGSEFTAAEIREEFGLPEDRVAVVPWGLAPVTGGNATAGIALAGGRRYVLALGTIEPRKNVPGLVARVRRGRGVGRRRPPRRRGSRRLGPGRVRRAPSTPRTTAAASCASGT